MRTGKVALAVCFFMLFIPLAFSQEAVMELNHKEIGSHERAPVQFGHEKHATDIHCLQCHHDYDGFGNNKGGEDAAQQCSNCHGQPNRPNLLPLTEAFHRQCKSCHESLHERNRKSGPVMCGECHVKH